MYSSTASTFTVGQACTKGCRRSRTTRVSALASSAVSTIGGAMRSARRSRHDTSPGISRPRSANSVG
nr:hypothetical protein [Solimonas soli]